jgi:hypothetical protein
VTSDMVGGVIWVAGASAMLCLLLLARRGRRKGGAFTAAVAGTLHDLHSQDKRRAIEIVLQERAARKDPETADGTDPDVGQERRDHDRQEAGP